jgi:hypothetical protein
LFAGFFGMVCAAVVRAVCTLAVNGIGRPPIPLDGPEADYRDLADPPG